MLQAAYLRGHPLYFIVLCIECPERGQGADTDWESLESVGLQGEGGESSEIRDLGGEGGNEVVIDVEVFQCSEIAHCQWEGAKPVVGEVESGQRSGETGVGTGKVSRKLRQLVLFQNEVLDVYT